MSKHNPLNYEDVRFHISEKQIETIPLPIPEKKVIGQSRAIKALEMGMEIKAPGYNIFVTGLPGTGRTTAVKKILERFENTPFPSRDIAIVNNFKHSENPRVLYFPPGGATAFREKLKDMMTTLQAQIYSKLEGQGYKKIKTDIIANTQNHERKVLQVFEARLNTEGFTSITRSNKKEETADSIDIAYLWNSKPVPMNQLTELASKGGISEKDFQNIQKKYYSLKDDLRSIFRAVLQTKNEMQRELNTLKIITVTPEVHTEISNLKQEYPDPRIKKWLDSVAEDISENLYLFSGDTSREETQEQIRNIRYGLNILEDRSAAIPVPVIFETHPTFKNLFGTIDRGSRDVAEFAEYLSIKSGAFIRASGGFLILQAEDLFLDEKAWEYMKRTLKTGKVSILSQGNRTLDTPRSIKPEEIQIDVKVILIGNENLYEILYHKDPDFHRYFKISAEFDNTIPRDDDSMGQYLQFIEMLCLDENLLPLTLSAKAAVIKFGARLAEDRNKLSTRFSYLKDILIEADYWANKEEKTEITEEIINRTQLERQYLNNLPEEKINEMISVGDINIPLSGTEVGLINALAIQDRGYLAFGTPCLISSKTSPGDTGIINIEGEVGLSGEIHDKWIMMLEGYLRHHYASKVPLALHCTICFEQSYGEVDGDSAAAAELYAILSSIANIPLRLDLAVTGSISQTGSIQAIGGATEKVEGFFDICNAAGLSGTQGVIIPDQNVKNLILANRVIQAVKEGTFHIYPIKTINDGIEILSGMTAGTRGAKGNYPAGSFNYIVEKNLKALHLKIKNSHG